MKNRNTVFIIALLGLILQCCNNINTKDITIIDGVKLGTSVEKLNRQCDSLKVEQKVFYKKIIFKSSEGTINSQFQAHITDLFNTSEYKSPLTQHYGIYYPLTLEGTKNVIGLFVLLVHASPAYSFSDRGVINLTKETDVPGISQNISYGQIDHIANMLSEKYGKPSDTLKSELLPFFVIEDTQIKTYNSDSKNTGEMIVWKTKYLDVKFFKGISSKNSIFDSQEHNYLTSISSEPIRNIDYSKGERYCHSFSYISYKLNDEAIKILELDKVKL
jgi:hypothetical protein